ncbi:MAG: hypothetical protein H6977_09045 [Gammaproteobacteria bacterium]|nr:hypothetical protein [Gammaproteobacteria bacterium]MCP5200149.1 hypothetical protein [Gammaproteobacteria bacterium]
MFESPPGLLRNESIEFRDKGTRLVAPWDRPPGVAPGHGRLDAADLGMATEPRALGIVPGDAVEQVTGGDQGVVERMFDDGRFDGLQW